MAGAVRAGIWYFLIIFAAGFVLGTLRVLILVPHLGDIAAVFVELPIMLALSWVASSRLTARADLPAGPVPRFVMGAVAFGLLMIAELGLATLLFGQSASAHFASYATLAGAAGLCAQAVFGVMPYLQWRIRRP